MDCPTTRSVEIDRKSSEGRSGGRTHCRPSTHDRRLGRVRGIPVRRPAKKRREAIKDAGAELVPITKPESRWGAKYDEFWAPIEDLAEEEPEEELVPAPLSMALDEPNKPKRGGRH
jgi:hypothetical protein